MNYVPENSEEVRDFMRNSSIQNRFLFNATKQFQIEGSKYIEELKEVSKRTTDYLYVYYTNFSSKEFCELVSVAKNVKRLYFAYDFIPLDKEFDFGSDMKGCKIEQFYLNYSGNSNYSNWSQNPNRLENLIAAIAKCEPLTKSLKRLYIQYCDIAKEKAQEILNKYKLNGVTLYA